MANNTILNPGMGGDTIATKDIGGVKHELVMVEFDNGLGGSTDVSETNPLPVTSVPIKSSTSNITSVNVSGTNQNFLLANTSRLGATIFNNSQINLYVILGTIASTSSFTVILFPNAYYEVPFSYDGNIDGIWASGGSGAALITELTP